MDREATERALARSWFQCYPLDHEDPKKRGLPIVRRKTCECGREFDQYLLSERQLAAAERMRLIPLFEQQTKDFRVPVHCPPCERRDLGRQARLDELRAEGRGESTRSVPLQERIA
jgi:hypothetical protein